MKRVNFIQSIILSILIMIISACNSHNEQNVSQNNNIANTIEENTDEHNHEGTEVSLSKEQIENIGLTFTHIAMKELNATVKASGLLKVPSNKKALVTSILGGKVKNIHILEGDHVTKGQIVASIENADYLQKQEEYLTLLNKTIFAEQEYNRQKELFDNNAGAKKNLQNAQAELNALKASKLAIQSQLQMLGININLVQKGQLQHIVNIVSPISGRVSKIYAQVGTYISATTPLAEIVDNASLHLDLNIFEKDLPNIKIGQIIHFTLTNNPANEYDAEVFSIGSAFENESKTIPIHAKVKGEKNGLIDGMNVTGIISLTKQQYPSVPSNSIVESGGKYYIFVLDNNHSSTTKQNDMHFKRIEVMVGVSEVGYTAIVPINEILPDTKIVNNGAFFVNAKMTNTTEHGH